MPNLDPLRKKGWSEHEVAHYHAFHAKRRMRPRDYLIEGGLLFAAILLSGAASAGVTLSFLLLFSTLPALFVYAAFLVAGVLFGLAFNIAVHHHHWIGKAHTRAVLAFSAIAVQVALVLTGNGLFSILEEFAGMPGNGPAIAGAVYCAGFLLTLLKKGG